MTNRDLRPVPISRRRLLQKSAVAAGALALPLKPLRARADGLEVVRILLLGLRASLPCDH
jgi:hypothetical protein